MDVPDAADALEPGLRLAVSAPGSDLLPRWSRAGLRALRGRSPAFALRQSQARSHASAGRQRAGAVDEVYGNGRALRVRTVLRAPGNRSRQGRGRIAWTSHPLAAPCADSNGQRPAERESRA